MRLIEWVGLPSIFANPKYKADRIAGRISPALQRAFRQQAMKRPYRIPGRSIRLITRKDLPGLNREYQWGPTLDAYVQRMTEADWKLLAATEAGQRNKEFVDVTDGPYIETDPANDLVVLRETEYASVRDFLQDMREGSKDGMDAPERHLLRCGGGDYHGVIKQGGRLLEVRCRSKRCGSRTERVFHTFDLATGQMIGTRVEPRNGNEQEYSNAIR